MSMNFVQNDNELETLTILRNPFRKLYRFSNGELDKN